MTAMDEAPTERLYTRDEVDAAVAEALRRVRYRFRLWNLEHCVEHVEAAADELGVTIPDE